MNRGMELIEILFKMELKGKLLYGNYTFKSSLIYFFANILKNKLFIILPKMGQYSKQVDRSKSYFQ